MTRKRGTRGTGGRPARPSGAARAATAPDIPVAAAEAVLGISVAEARRRYDALMPREREVAAGMATGERNKDLAERLGISPKTLDIHRANVMGKLQARTAAQVANAVNLLRLAGKAGGGVDG